MLWKVLSEYGHGAPCPYLAAPLNGELLAELDLDRHTITNRDLLEGFRYLAYYQESGVRPYAPSTGARPCAPTLRQVNYAALDVGELGSVYESLLELHPVIDASDPSRPRFHFATGTERKSTGSYYTPPELVAELIRSALEPVVAERLK